MAQERKIETYENKARTVKKPEAVINHKQTKQYKEGETIVEKNKTVGTVKLTRAQIVEKFTMDISGIAQADAKLAALGMRAYETLFQVGSAKDFMAMVQSVDVENGGHILLKSGYNLPILPEDDVVEFLQMFNAITDENAPLTVNIVKFKIDNPEFDERTSLFTYALFELVGAGRRTPNTDWSSVEAKGTFEVNAEGKFSRLYTLIMDYIADPENEAAALKGALLALAPNAFEAFSGLFNRESFKKLGIVISSPTEGKEALLTPFISEIIGYMLFDTFGDYAVVVEDEEEEETENEEEAEVEVKKPVTSQKSTQKPKVEVKPAPVVEEDEEDEIDVEDDEDSSNWLEEEDEDAEDDEY